MAYIKGEPFIPQFIDPATGLLMASGTIEFYLSGTSTPTPYYTDSAGTSGGTSLTLDVGGEPPTDIYYDDGIAYKIIVKDAAGSTLDTIDPYNVVSSSSFVLKRQYISDLTSESATIGQLYSVEDYASGYGAGVMYFRAVAAGTGTADGGSYFDHDTLPFQLERIFNPGTINVAEFGVVAGEADSYAKAQAAIDYAQGSAALDGSNSPIDLGSQTVSPPEVVFGDGIFNLSEVLKTKITNGYDEGGSLGLIVRGVGQKTILRRNNIPASGGINFARSLISDAQERFDGACLAINASFCSVLNMSFKDSYIGLYLGDNPHRSDINLMTEPSAVDKAHSSHGRYDKLWMDNCGAAIFAESTHGIYYNTFQSILMRECQVGFACQEITTAATFSKTNRNTFINVRANRCGVGYLLNDFNTNTMLGMHAEDCDINATGLAAALAVIPSNLSTEAAATDFGTNGGGHVFESTADKNLVYGCVNESCDNDLFNAGVDNKFLGVDFDLDGGKVFFESVPKFYMDANTQILQSSSYKSWGAGAAGAAELPANRALPGITFDKNDKGVPIIQDATGLYDDTTTAGRIRSFKFVDKVDSLANSTTHTFSVVKSDNVNGQDAFSAKVIISTRDTTGGNQFYHELNIAGGSVGSGTGIDRYDIVSETSFKTNGANSSAVATEITTALALATTDVADDTLQLSITCGHASGFDMVISSVEVVGGLPVDG